MSRIRSSGTSPEEKLSRLLKRLLGPRQIERNVRTLPGQPDIVVPSLRLAVFVDGCFYHSCPRHGHNPKSNKGYWVPKLARNLARDKVSRTALREMGFSVWKVWEHSLKGRQLDRLNQRLTRRLERRIATYSLSHLALRRRFSELLKRSPLRKASATRGEDAALRDGAKGRSAKTDSAKAGRDSV